ncbi:MAG: hypothetical protein IKG81_08715 [Bacteroidales bacterium]|nr:hypothetical protein [Bacteroidales bacterium]
MALLKKIRLPIEKRLQKIQKKRIVKTHVRKVKRNFDRLPEKKELTKDQKKEIRAFYKRLTGEKVPLIWHQYFYSRNGIYAKEYLPTSLYRMQLMDRVNNGQYREAYVDKNMLDVLLPNVKHPHVYLKNMNGYFYMEGEPVSREAVIERLKNLDGAIIKPSLESHGRGVRKLVIKEGMTNVDGFSLGQLLNYYGKNYLIQDSVQQHESLAALNPSSVNTIRILTYRSGMEIIPLYTVIRIGRKGQEIDNESSGGISTKINADGTLGKYAYGDVAEGQIEKTDSGIVLEGYKIPYLDKAVETVKKCHYQLPFFDLIGWDVSISKDGEPIIIEWNVHTELSQSAYGPAFGEYTERIINEIWSRENTINHYW